MGKVLQTLPDNAREATGDDFFNRVGDRTLIRASVQYYEDTVSGYVLKVTSVETDGENLLRLIRTKNIFVIPN